MIEDATSIVAFRGVATRGVGGGTHTPKSSGIFPIIVSQSGNYFRCRHDLNWIGRGKIK
jgi:hypothetical protein